MPSASVNEAVLAVDAGSSSARAMLCDRRGADIGDTFTQIAARYDRTPDADAVCNAVFECIDAALEKGKGAAVGQVVVDTFVTSVMGIDAGGAPTTPLFTWSDARGSELLPTLVSRIEPRAYTQRTGAYLHPSYWPLRLLWLREAEPDAYAATRTWVSFGAYLMQRIFGERAMSISDAAWSGLLNRTTLAWDDETLAALELSADVLPQIRRTVSVPPPPFPNWRDARQAGIGRMTDEFARRWPGLAGALWHPPIGDGVASNIGAGCATPRQVALSIGTSGAMRVIVDGTPDTVPDGLFCYRIDDRRSLLGGALSNAGSVYEWVRDTFRFDGAGATDAALNAISPDSHGLTMLPYLAPERSPLWDGGIPAVVIGLTPATTPLAMLRASLEAVALGFSRIARRLTPLLPPDVTFTAGGGVVDRSPAFMQTLADALGYPITAAPSAETTIRGAVLFHTGELPEPDTSPRVYRPDAARMAVYAGALARQERLLTLFADRAI